MNRFLSDKAGRRIVAMAGSLLVGAAPLAAADASRGLWVGQITLNYVNEVAVPLDENNFPVAPDPTRPTPTADQAHLRLILHVDGAGKASLLKDVAVLNRVGSPVAGGARTVNLNTNRAALAAANLFVTADSDVSLVTDERLYSQFPAQAAVRFASVTFDFGDGQATAAVDEMVRVVAIAAAGSVATTGETLTTDAGRNMVEAAAVTAATPLGAAVVARADVAESFARFLSTNFNSLAVDAIAAAADPAAQVAPHAAVAATIRDGSFYRDDRGVRAVAAVLAAVQGSTTPEARRTNAHHAAAVFADTANQYGRFIAGQSFGAMIVAAANAAADAATNALTVSPGAVRRAVDRSAVVNDVRTEATRAQVAAYRDTRATVAVELVLNAVVASVVNLVTNPPVPTREVVVATALAAGRTALADGVPRYAPAVAPTLDYTAFVRTNPPGVLSFQTSVAVAAAAAAKAAVAERRDNTLYTAASLQGKARAAAINALRDVYGQAARAGQTELPLNGVFGAGQGDSRLTFHLRQTNGPPLGPAALSGEILLPANHPTNPFRHRRHPDHTTGIDLTRRLRLDFNPAPTGAVARAGYGVDRLTGTYREEIVGLHKPLGPQKNVGLRVEGVFELNRVSLIDTLNAR